jgi:predicted nucleic acid-binding protein
VAFYIDSSALTKLAKLELESNALRAYLEVSDESLATSVVTAIEVARAVSRESDLLAERAAEALDSAEQVPISEFVVSMASRLTPVTLRTLDAIHIASALELGSECSAVITYDQRMAEACRLAGLTVVAPA